MSADVKRRIGIVGFGHVGLYLVQKILGEGEKCNLELAFVWNRTMKKLDGVIDPRLQLHQLSEFRTCKADLIVEVAHPDITRHYGESFLSATNLMIGSPTVLSDPDIERKLRDTAKASGHTLYVPSGALWGGEDIQRMADSETLKGLRITMTKHPESFQLKGELSQRKQAVHDRTILYEGPVRDLCPLAPNNVNTMAAACMAAHTLGFDHVIGVLVADPSIPDWHIVDIEVTGVKNKETGQAFSVTTTRRNPAQIVNAAVQRSITPPSRVESPEDRKCVSGWISSMYGSRRTNLSVLSSNIA